MAGQASNACPAHGIPQRRLTVTYLIQRVRSRGINGEVYEELVEVTALVMRDFIRAAQLH